MLPVDGSDWRDVLPLTSFPGLAAMLKPPLEGSGQAAPSPPDQAAPSPPDRSTDLQVFTEPPPHLLPPAMEEEDEAGEVSRDVVDRCCIVVKTKLFISEFI